MKSFAFSLFFILSFFSLDAQNKLIAVGSGDNTFLTTSFQSAINAANPGDTIYLNGAIYNLPTSSKVTKEVHIIGTGHHPDSTTVTGISQIEGRLTFAEGSDGSSIKGVYFIGTGSFSAEGAIRIGESATTTSVSNITIERCNIAKLYLGFGISQNTDASNITIRENVIRYFFHGGFATNVLVENNYLQLSGLSNLNTMEKLDLAIFKNNFIRAGNWSGIVQCLFQNNTISGNEFGSNNHYSNNIFTATESVFSNTINANGGGNIFGQTYTTTYPNSTGVAFDYISDYHLAPNHPGTNAGSDGTNIGLYGGLHPWKPFSVPCNPHLVSKNVTQETASDGTINVQINVTAQDN